MRQEATAVSSPALGDAFVATYYRAFLVGPGFFAGLANGDWPERLQTLLGIDEPCQWCADVLPYNKLQRLADDNARHAALFRCPECRSLYEVLPDETVAARHLDLADARKRFPDAF